MAVTMLRSGVLGDRRFFALEAARLAESTKYEAWIACGYIDAKAGAGATSDCLRTADSIEELKAWAEALAEAEIQAFIDDCCS